MADVRLVPPIPDDAVEPPRQSVIGPSEIVCCLAGGPS